MYTKKYVAAAAASLLLLALFPSSLSGGEPSSARESLSAKESLSDRELSSDRELAWNRALMDASRTGVTVPGADDIPSALGTVRCRTYYAPNGRIYKGGSIRKVAATVIEAQKVMTPVKKVVAYCEKELTRFYPESPLTNWFADNLIRATEKETGRHVSMSVGNFGGIRVDMPQGDVLMDDIRSMFPFKNDLVYVALKGSDIRAILQNMAATRFQVLGGVRVVARDGVLESVEIDGEPLDDDKVYGVATISFLMNGGDGLRMAENAVEIINIPVDIYEAMIGIVQEETAAGRHLDADCDGRVQILPPAER